MWETWVQSLGWEDPLEEGMVTHSSILAWRIPMDKGAWRATVHGVTNEQLSTQHVFVCVYISIYVDKEKQKMHSKGFFFHERE